MMKRIVLLILVLLIASIAVGQENKSRIVGTVTTSDGQVIEGATITITSTSLIGTTQTATTNDRGRFRFVLLPLGKYDVKFEKKGYSPIEQKAVNLDYDSTVTLDKVMQLSEFEEVITITGESPLVDKTNSSMGDKLDVDFLQNMPNQRSVWDMPNLTAGFTNDSALGAPSEGANALSQDGVIIHDAATKTVFARINYEAVEQVDVAMFGSPAEYHSFTGASLNFVTKSGGNEFHGEANYFHQDLDWVSDNTGAYEGLSTPTGSNIMDPNFTLGGPVLHDRLWFFGTYNYSKEKHQHQIIDGKVNADYIPTIWSIKLTNRWDDRNLSSFSFNDYFRDRPYRVAYGDWINNYDGSLYKQVSKGKTAVFVHSFVLTDDIILEGRYSHFTGGFDLDGRDMSGHIYRDYDTGDFLQPTNDKYTHYDRPRDTVLGTVNYFNDDLGGSHSMKFGGEYERGVSGSDYWNRFYFRYRNGNPYRWYDYGEYNSRAVQQRIGAFAQDSWSVNDQLTLNIGARFDHWWSTSGSEIKGSMGDSKFRTYNDFAPRLGLAYDLFGDGKTVLKAFFGWYFEGVTAGTDSSFVTEALPTVQYRWRNNDWYVYSVTGGNTPGAVEFDEESVNMHTKGLMLGIDHELNDKMAVSATFIYRKDYDLRGTIYPNATWDEGTASYSNNGYSYNGVYYYDYKTVNPEIYTNPKKGDNGILGDMERSYMGLILEFNKRISDNYSLKASYTLSKGKSPTGMAYGDVQGGSSFSNPNGWINSEDQLSGNDRPHVLKVSGTYFAPFGILISPVFSWMAGSPMGIYYTPSGQSDAIMIKPLDGSDRYDSQMRINLRAEKTFTINEQYRLGFVADVFNLTNSDYLTGYKSNSIQSSAFMVPSSIASARIYSVGVRLSF